MIIEKHFEAFALVERNSQPDLFGGTTWVYTTKKLFRAGAVNSESTHRNEPKDSLSVGYKILHEYGISLHHDDYVKRLSDGRMFRVLSDSDDMRTPPESSQQYAQVDAEVVYND